jgi:hypothetical protein
MQLKLLSNQEASPRRGLSFSGLNDAGRGIVAKIKIFEFYRAFSSKQTWRTYVSGTKGLSPSVATCTINMAIDSNKRGYMAN